MEDHDLHFIGKVAQKGIITRDGKLLVCRGVGDTLWEFPGGRLHSGEIPQEGLRREIREELGLEVGVGRVLHVMRSYHERVNSWLLFIGYECHLTSAEEYRLDGDEVEEAKWVTPEELLLLPMYEDCHELAQVYVKG